MEETQAKVARITELGVMGNPEHVAFGELVLPWINGATANDLAEIAEGIVHEQVIAAAAAQIEQYAAIGNRETPGDAISAIVGGWQGS